MSMHFVAAWDIKAQGQRKTEIDMALKACLSGYSSVSALPYLYIIKVNSQTDWDSIREKLVSVGRVYTSDVNFIITPLMNGGQYNGWLPKNLWPQIEERNK